MTAIDGTPVHKDDSDIPLTSTQYPAVPTGGPTQAAFDTLATDVANNTADITVNIDNINVAGGDISDNFALIGTNTTELANRLKLDTTQSLTSGTLKLSSNSNQQVILQHTGYADLKIYSNFGQAGIDWKAGTAKVVFDGGRVSINGVMLRPPMRTTDPADPAPTSQGCLYVDTSIAGAYKLKFHDGTSWVTIS